MLFICKTHLAQAFLWGYLPDQSTASQMEVELQDAKLQDLTYGNRGLAPYI